MTLGVPCHDAESTLSHVLAAVEAQTERPQRLIGVDDYSDDDTSILLQERETIELHRNHRRRGPAAARNAILEMADTDLVAIVDDDVRLAPDWLATLLATLRETDAALVAGAVTEGGDGSSARWRTLRAPHNPYEDPGEVPWVDASAVLARTDAIRSVGGWPEPSAGPESAWPAAHEALCARLRAAGETIYHESAAEATHLGSETTAAALRALWRADLDESSGVGSATDVLRRLGRHVGTCWRCAGDDLAERRWWALPITVRIPIAFALHDVRRLRTGDRFDGESGTRSADATGARSP